MRGYHVATVLSKGQVTIPKAIRERLGLKPGDSVSLAVADGAIVLAPIRRRIAHETAGSLARHMRHR